MPLENRLRAKTTGEPARFEARKAPRFSKLISSSRCSGKTARKHVSEAQPCLAPPTTAAEEWGREGGGPCRRVAWLAGVGAGVAADKVDKVLVHAHVPRDLRVERARQQIPLLHTHPAHPHHRTAHPSAVCWLHPHPQTESALHPTCHSRLTRSRPHLTAYHKGHAHADEVWVARPAQVGLCSAVGRARSIALWGPRCICSVLRDSGCLPAAGALGFPAHSNGY